MDQPGEKAQSMCMWCGRTVTIVDHQGVRVVCRHDNRNNSGFCQGSLVPLLGGPGGKHA